MPLRTQQPASAPGLQEITPASERQVNGERLDAARLVDKAWREEHTASAQACLDRVASLLLSAAEVLMLMRNTCGYVMSAGIFGPMLLFAFTGIERFELGLQVLLAALIACVATHYGRKGLLAYRERWARGAIDRTYRHLGIELEMPAAPALIRSSTAKARRRRDRLTDLAFLLKYGGRLALLLGCLPPLMATFFPSLRSDDWPDDWKVILFAAFPVGFVLWKLCEGLSAVLSQQER